MSEALSNATNVVDFDGFPRPTPPKLKHVPAGTAVHEVFSSGHPDEDRLRGSLQGITLAGGPISLRERRLVHRVLTPVLEIGQATQRDQLVISLRAAGFDINPRRARYGPTCWSLRDWIDRCVEAVWDFEGQTGDLPSWLAALCEIIAQEAIRPHEVDGLPPANFFTPWEITSKIRYT